MAMPSQFPSPPIHPQIQNQMEYNAPSIFQHLIEHQPGSWSQIPQVPPMCMPWTVPNVQHPEVVTFTGENPSTSSVHSTSSFIHQKRKLDLSDTPPIRPTKQFLTEEKMAAHFRNMHISSNYNFSPVPSTSQPTSNNNNNNNNISSSSNSSSTIDLDLETNPLNLDGKSMHPRLVISEEIKRLQQEPLLPTSLLSKLERPSMALVLWEPPSKHLRVFSSPQLPNNSVENNDNDNNSKKSNNKLINNNDQSDVESMDL